MKSKETNSYPVITASYHPPASIGYCYFDHMWPNTCINNAFPGIRIYNI